jgi:hypothetical protein
VHRVHSRRHRALWFGQRDARSRWDDPSGEFGVLYLGRSPVGAFAETLLRAPEDRDVVWSHVAQRRTATFRVVEPLQLMKLHGEGLAWFEVTAADIAEGDYAVTQRISSRVNGDVPVDGIQYRSRFDNDELCVALFDRAEAKIALESEGETIDPAWARAILGKRGYRLIDL